TLGGTGSQTAGQAIVNLEMNAAGARTWSRLTGANIGRRIAIVLDDRIHMAPVIRTKIPGGRTTIEGMANMEEAKDIAIVLRAGA
ncbi:MAG: protein translocase subunit SecD, partial [Gammaproteobacteria bacterium]|nr:protein translocase subunit SecD [Gammaproteobacteria bacterium]NIW46354.1 protein translocase subunit SecD [Gammaproteobacteria bacterium]NIX57395.1 protein translocase subunit SecD [candidate division Zixibacteria bacterium]